MIVNHTPQVLHLTIFFQFFVHRIFHPPSILTFQFIIFSLPFISHFTIWAIFLFCHFLLIYLFCIIVQVRYSNIQAETNYNITSLLPESKIFLLLTASRSFLFRSQGCRSTPCPLKITGRFSKKEMLITGIGHVTNFPRIGQCTRLNLCY